MWQTAARTVGALFLWTALFTGPAVAEIYKWVDENGNIHFGDKPTDKAQAEKAERVDIVESYQPAEMTDEEQAAFDQEQEALRRRTDMYRSEDEEKRRTQEEERRKKQAATCRMLEEQISKLSTMKRIRGVRTYHYAEEEEGEPVSSARQREIVAELRQEYEDEGC